MLAFGTFSVQIIQVGYDSKLTFIVNHRPQTDHFNSPHLFPQREASCENIPHSCPAGDYTSKLQLYRRRRGHPGNLLPPTAILSGTSRSLSLHRCVARMHPAADGPTRGLCVTSASLSLRAKAGQRKCRQPQQN